MTISWDAEKNTITSAVTATADSDIAGFWKDEAAIAAASASWNARSHPRRRPSSGSG